MILVDNLKSNNLSKLGETYKFVFIGVLSAMAGALMMLPYASAVVGLKLLLVVVLEFVILFAFIFKKTPLLFYIFTLLTGVTLVPALNHLISEGSSYIIIQTLALTTAITGGLTFYASSTKRNFLTMGTFLFWVLIGVLGLLITNIFIGSSIFALFLSYVIAVMFSFYMIYDTQRVLYTDVSPIEAAMDLYLNFINLFVSLLNINK